MKLKFEEFTFLKEYPEMIAGRFPLRIYTSRFAPDDHELPIEQVRYHFGFPEKMVPEGFRSLVSSTPYWGESPWKEEDGFWIWHTHIVSNVGEIPSEKLEKQLDFMFRAYNNVIALIKKR